jgi:Holliday junction DNA helicase RuvA
MYTTAMIGHISGTVFSVGATHCIVSVHGLGYKVAALKDVLLAVRPGDSLSLFTHLAVREDAQDLYGFRTEEELRFFELLLTVSGIGPRSALAILDIASIETLRSAIAEGREEYLTNVSGIGKKTAGKIVLELRDKVGLVREGTAGALKGDEEALEAMRALGYSSAEGREALRKVPREIERGNDRLREALKILGTK